MEPVEAFKTWTLRVLGMGFFAVPLAWAISRGGFPLVALLFALPLGLAMVWWLFQHPRNGLLLTISLAFVLPGLMRYVPGPLGLSVDFLLVITIIVAIMHPKLVKDLSLLNNPLFWVTLIWFGYTFLELFNPLARSREAWFYAVRGVSLYQLMLVPLGLLFFNKNRDLKIFLNIWIILSIIATFWAMRQLFVGVDSFEMAWLNGGPRKTHILFGKLRPFSFFSDAGQFGAGMGHTGIVAAILASGPFSNKKKLFFGIAALICFYGMVISGTRGGLFVPVAGVLSHTIATRRLKVVLAIALVLGSGYVFLKHTKIANQNYQVRRMRTALDPNDASFQVRLTNQRKFKEYLANKPFGGGIGSGGSWGQRFSPGTFLAETALDSWYVKIWAEAGVVGLTIHLIFIFYFIGYGIWRCHRIRAPQLRTQLYALQAGFSGIAFASYGNPILGQLPTGIILFIGLAFMFNVDKLEAEALAAGDTEEAS